MGNSVYNNSFVSNGLGLGISGSMGNSVYHNNFVSDSQQVSLNESSDNIWNDGYYGGGNYWSDSNSTDVFWTPSQNEIGRDGIADFPYVISANPGEEDKYPFIYPNGWSSTPEISITSPSNKTYRTSSLPLLLATNKPVRWTYSLDDQANLTIGGNVMLVDLPNGAHKIIVYASDNSDNNASSEAIFSITFLGDINADGAVNILDISIIAHSFNCRPEDERWNPIADLNNDGVINILDVSIVAREFGKKT
jgi:hypothetical protein